MNRIRKNVTFDFGEFRRPRATPISQSKDSMKVVVNIGSTMHSYILPKDANIRELHQMVLKTANDDRMYNDGKILLYCEESPMNIFDKIASIPEPNCVTAKIINASSTKSNFSKFNIRFRIPMDIQELVEVTPLQYLR